METGGTEIHIVEKRTLRNTRKPWQRLVSSSSLLTVHKKKIWSMKIMLWLRKYEWMIRKENVKLYIGTTSYPGKM